MKERKIWIMMLVCLLLLCSCDKIVKQKSEEKLDLKNIIILIDGSASYQSLDLAKMQIIEILNNRNSPYALMVKWISDNSFSDDTQILYLENHIINKPSKFDAKGMKKYKKDLKNIDEKIKEACEKINNLKSPQFPATDIRGSLTVLQNVKKDVIYMFTDLSETENLDIDLSLKKTQILIYLETKTRDEFFNAEKIAKSLALSGAQIELIKLKRSV